MKIIPFTFLTVLSLQASSISLERYLLSIESSSAVTAIKAQSAAQTASQATQVQSAGFYLNGELGYASDKNQDRDKIEYHFSVEKNFRFGDSDAYINALKLSTQSQQLLKLNRLKNTLYSEYINACTLQEEAGLLRDMLDRHTESTSLIKIGVEGGEFDRSTLLQSELIVDELKLHIAALESSYFKALQTLQLYTKEEGEPLCQDLPYKLSLTQEFEKASLLYQNLENQITTSTALHNFYDTPVQDITVGIGYDNEMDLSRAIAFVQIPLTQGSRRQNEREVAIQSKLAAQEQLIFTKAQIDAEIRSYKNIQETRKKNLQKLRNILIPKAYESAVLLQERFMGSEGSYLAYIQSQKLLFDLLLRDISTHSKELLAQAKLYKSLGIDPQMEIK